VDNNTWSWELRDYEVNIHLNGPPHAFALAQSNGGLSFTSDRLVAAVAHGDQIYAITAAFFEIADTSDTLSNYSADRLLSQNADFLDNVYFANMQTELFRIHGEEVARWNSATQQFATVRAAQDPYQQRALATTARLRFSLTDGAVRKEVRVDPFDGSTDWVPFDFVEAQFPFDVVTSMAIHENELYVGTAAGLQHYSAQLATGLDSLAHLYDLRRTENEALAAVSRVGRPADDPELLMVRTDERCMERRNRTPFAPCDDTELLDARLRIENSLWRWFTDDSGQITGEYRLHDGGFSPLPVTIRQGRFPHDRLTDALVCNDMAYTLWADDMVTVFADDTVRLRPDLHTYPFTAEAPRRFICVARDIPLMHGTIRRGLYLENAERTIWRFANGQWMAVATADLLAGLQDHADRPPVVDGARLRLLTPTAGEPYTFEQRALSGLWHPLPWQEGRVALDAWHEVVLQNDTLWAATPMGIVSFDYRAKGQAVLDAETVHIVREPEAVPDECTISDMEMQGDQLLVRCNGRSNRVYRGDIGHHADTNVFTPIPAPDPFAERELVSAEETGYWQWHVRGRAGESDGSLQMMLHGEELELSAGRFEFDTINSLALFEADQVDSGTNVGGWFRMPRDSFHPRDMQRTELVDLDPTQMNRVHITLASKQRMLCLQTTRGQFIRLAPDDTHERLANCLEYLDEDGLWRYERDEHTLVATAPTSIGGAARRALVQGRFGDDTMIGPPVTGADDSGVFHLWPTYAGIFRMNQGFEEMAIYGPNFPGLPDGVAPSALFLAEGETPAYAGSTFLYSIEEPRTPLDTAPLAGPEGAIPLEVIDSVQNTVQVRWQAAPAPGWTLLSQSDANFSMRESLLVDVSEFNKFNQKRVAWDDPSPWIELHFEPGRIDVQWTGAQQSYSFVLPPEFVLLKPILAADRLLLIGQHEILAVNLERAMVGAFAASH